MGNYRPGKFLQCVCVEQLEERLLMSGDVRASMHDGRLEILCDSQDNYIRIDQQDLSAGQLRLSPDDSEDTTVNGGNQPIVFADVRNVIIRLGSGSDTLTIDGATIEGNLIIRGGRDYNTLNISDSAVKGRFAYRGGPLGDSLYLHSLELKGSASVRTGRGDDIIDCRDLDLDDSFRVMLGRGSDYVSVATIDSTSHVLFDGGPQVDSFSQANGTWKAQWHLRSFTTPAPTSSPNDVLPPGDTPNDIAIDSSWPDVRKLVAINNNFAFDLYRQLRAEQGNLFFSPESISMAMGMLYPGTRGQTAEQIAEVMGFGGLDGNFGEAFGSLLSSLTSDRISETGDPFTLNVVNSEWGQTDFNFLQDYLDKLSTDFRSEMQRLDFASDPETQRQAINQWVSDQTRQMIKDLLPEGVIDELTRLVLVNAMYFEASWQHKFHTVNQQAFHLSSGNVQVDMMHETEKFRYAEGDNYQAIELPYAGGASMVVLLPAEGRFGAFEENLSAAQMDDILQRMADTRVSVSLPRFECESSFGLKNTLSEMGVTDAFDEHEADLTGVANQNENDGWRLFVQDVIHKAKIELDQNGTKAAAATAVVIGAENAAYDPVPPPTVPFVADRPFIYLIRDDATGSTLFMGRVSDASAFPAPTAGTGSSGLVYAV